MRFGQPLLFGAAALALGACSLSPPAIQPVNYYLSATRGTPQAATKPVAVKVHPLRAAPLYERRAFVYRLDGDRIVTDFYNQFAESPESIITSALIDWLKAAHVFKVVVDPGLPVDAPCTLDGSIVTLAGDLRNPAKPAAVLAIQFYLVRARADGRDVLLDSLLEERVAIPAATAEALVQGYNVALTRIFERLEREIEGLDLRGEQTGKREDPNPAATRRSVDRTTLEARA